MILLHRLIHRLDLMLDDPQCKVVLRSEESGPLSAWAYTVEITTADGQRMSHRYTLTELQRVANKPAWIDAQACRFIERTRSLRKGVYIYN